MTGNILSGPTASFRARLSPTPFANESESMMNHIFTPTDAEALTAWLGTHNLSQGVGTAESACAVAAVNIVLGKGVTDDRPDCMSAVLHSWVTNMQDAIPDAMRNSPRFKALIPLLAGSGNDHEAKRWAMIKDHMWSVVFPLLQPQADAGGYGAAWASMCREKTQAAAGVAARAASKAVGAAWAGSAAMAATDGVGRMADAMAMSARAARVTDSSATAADAAGATSRSAWARAAGAAMEWASGVVGVEKEAGADFWAKADPVGLLDRLLRVGGARS